MGGTPHRPTRRAATLAALPLLLAGLVAWPDLSLAQSAVGVTPAPAASPAVPAGSPEPSAVPQPSAVPDPTAPLVSVVLDRTDVADGDTVTATVSVTNPGPDPMTLRCARPVDVWADITDVVEGPRQDWATTDPWRRGMRRQLLGDPLTGTGPLAVPLVPRERSPRCTEATTVLAAGETFTGAYTWEVGYADGTALFGPSGDPAIVRARVVPLRSPEQTAAGADPQPPGVGAAPVHVASVRSRRAMSPSRAIEALFADPEAAAWLDLEHASTWRRADLRLRGGRWLVDIRRVATGCCRESLSAAMDALSGEMRSLDAPLLGWEPAKTKVAYFENLELRLELQRRRFPDGRATRIRMTVTNLSEDGPVWYWSHDNSCTLQPDIWIAAGPEQVGARWPGLLGTFKRRALRGDLIISRAGAPAVHQCRVPEPLKLRKKGGSVTTESFFRPGIVPTGQRTLQAIGRIDLVGPSSDTVRPWRVYASPEVKARFKTGDGSTQIDSPAMLIDAALSQKAFAKRIKATPRFRWKAAGVTGTTVGRGLKDGTRIVALPRVEG